MLFRLVFLSIITSLFSSSLTAHPHSWINLRTEFILDNNDRLVGIQQHWEFDVYYSMMAIADMLNEHLDKEKGLEVLENNMVKNLQSYDFFTHFRIDSEKVSLDRPTDYQLRTLQKDGQEILQLSMLFPINGAPKIENKLMTLSVYDPTFYIDMRHYDVSQISIRVNDGLECSVTVNLPEPSEELIEYAASLDKNQKNTEGLGKQFAEQVHVSCI